MKLVIETKEKLMKDNEETLNKIEVKRRRESIEVQELRSMADSKSKEIESLTKKVRWKEIIIHISLLLKESQRGWNLSTLSHIIT